MKEPFKTFCNWSGGKDSALACYYAMQDERYSVEKLVTNIEQNSHRIAMHGIREDLLDVQAAAIGLPLQKLTFPAEPNMLVYESIVHNSLQQLKDDGYTHNVYGDIFLEDLKQYRETSLQAFGLTGVFPLWRNDTKELLQTFISLGFKAMVVCVQASKLDKSFAGRIIDNDFINDLPPGVDPCGENGEFHTFVFDGPIFKAPVTFSTGEYFYKELNAPSSELTATTATTQKMGFWYRDIHA